MTTSALTPEEIEAIERVQRARSTGTHYDVLHIDISSPREEVERAYFALARIWHPDRFYRRQTGAYKEAIEENFDAFTQAFTVLRDEGKRNAYDREIKRRGLVPAPRPPMSVVDPPPPADHAVAFRRSGTQVTINPVAVSVHDTSVSRHRPKHSAPAAVTRLKDQIAQQLAKARVYYESGKAGADAGNWATAESAYYLATRYDPKNEQYQAAFREASQKARLSRVSVFVQQGDQAAGYGRYREAVAAYRKACECDPPDAAPYFKLGQMLASSEDDQRGAIDAYRKAVAKNGKEVSYRWALAELYEKAGLKQYAFKELRSILELEPKHDGAVKMQKRLKAAGL